MGIENLGNSNSQKTPKEQTPSAKLSDADRTHRNICKLIGADPDSEGMKKARAEREAEDQEMLRAYNGSKPNILIDVLKNGSYTKARSTAAHSLGFHPTSESRSALMEAIEEKQNNMWIRSNAAQSLRQFDDKETTLFLKKLVDNGAEDQDVRDAADQALIQIERRAAM